MVAPRTAVLERFNAGVGVPSLLPAEAAASVGRVSAPTADKPRLPRLQPHVNKRAQQIIAAHMRSSSAASSVFSSAPGVPVLVQIESTAPRTARTHDISHLCDRGRWLTPSIPSSLVAEGDHVYEAGCLPQDASSAYCEADGLWHTKVFPSCAPSSRKDAVMLDAWITRSLERYRESGGAAFKEDLAQSVVDLVPILSVALHEIARQITHHCVERGVALEQIWRTYVELFYRVLRQMQESLRDQKQKTTGVQEILGTARESLQGLRKSHPKAMHRVIADLETRFTKEQRELEEELERCVDENSQLKTCMRDHHVELELWFPGFAYYADSYIKGHIPQSTHLRPGRSVHRPPTSRRSVDGDGTPPASAEGAAHAQENERTPEVAIAEDFKRLLAVLAPEKRKMIGQDLVFIMDPNAVLPAQRAKSKRRGSARQQQEAAAKGQAQGSQEERKTFQRLKAEVQLQDDRIRELREEIASLEATQAAAAEEAAAAASAAEGGGAGGALVHLEELVRLASKQKEAADTASSANELISLDMLKQATGEDRLREAQEAEEEEEEANLQKIATPPLRLATGRRRKRVQVDSEGTGSGSASGEDSGARAEGQADRGRGAG